MGKQTAQEHFHIVLDGRAGEQHAPRGRKLPQTVDGGVAGGGLEAVALVAHEQPGLAGVDLVGVAAVHLHWSGHDAATS